MRHTSVVVVVVAGCCVAVTAVVVGATGSVVEGTAVAVVGADGRVVEGAEVNTRPDRCRPEEDVRAMTGRATKPARTIAAAPAITRRRLRGHAR